MLEIIFLDRIIYKRMTVEQIYGIWNELLLNLRDTHKVCENKREREVRIINRFMFTTPKYSIQQKTLSQGCL